MLSGWAESGVSPDFPANQRSRHGGSSAATIPRQPPPLPTADVAASVLDATGAAPLSPGLDRLGGQSGALLTADDVAALLRVPRSLIYALVRRGELPAVRIGERYVRFREQAIERWLEQREEADVRSVAPSSLRRTIDKASGSSPTADRGASGTSPRRRANAPEPGIRRIDPDAS
jgi:excisionase family DNA binding protein